MVKKARCVSCGKKKAVSKMHANEVEFTYKTEIHYTCYDCDRGPLISFWRITVGCVTVVFVLIVLMALGII